MWKLLTRTLVSNKKTILDQNIRWHRRFSRKKNWQKKKVLQVWTVTGKKKSIWKVLYLEKRDYLIMKHESWQLRIHSPQKEKRYTVTEQLRQQDKDISDVNLNLLTLYLIIDVKKLY